MLKLVPFVIGLAISTAATASVKELTCAVETDRVLTTHTVIYNGENFSTWTTTELSKKNGKTKSQSTTAKTFTSPTSIQLVAEGMFINRFTVSRENLAYNWTQATHAYPDMTNTVEQGICTVRELEKKMAF